MEEVTGLPQFEPGDRDAGFFQIEFHLERLDRRPEKNQGISGNREVTAEFPFARGYAPAGRKLAGEIGRAPAEEPGELAQIVDGGAEVAAKSGSDVIA